MDDRVIRAITVDGSFRVITACTTTLVREAIRVRNQKDLVGDLARTYGELLTGAILVRETMAPGQRVQAILSRAGQGQMIADSHPDDGDGSALTRGLFNRSQTLPKTQLEPAGSLAPQGPVSAVQATMLGEGSILKVIRSLPRGRIHQSIVEASASGMSAALMGYMQESEQVTATLVVATVMREGEVVASGGFIVQLLPEVTDGPLAVMTERLAHDFVDLDRFLLEHGADPRVLKDELLYGMPHADLAESKLRHGCDCSEERVLTAIATLGRDEVASIVAQGEVISITCEYCQTPWVLGSDRLRSLLTPN
ncbi:MAG: Hsp33 family molecular chaperone HslO [Deltaproteobacteria bacterium]|nr:Hsp33 family molecular chaperone HslO [Deltaproteobacteria bacterium]